jgi:alpha-beta hydrolase superfamily lysophospholipase
VGANGRGPQWLADAYRRAGVRDVTVRLYEEARHELLNELNRDAVERDLIGWLDGVLASTTPGP